jgi:hypothetical protein
MIQIQELRFYGTSTMIFDEDNNEAMILICMDGGFNMLAIHFGITSGGLGGRVSQMLLKEPFIALNTEADVHEIDCSSNDLILRALGNEQDAKKEIIEVFAKNLALIAHEVIVSRVDSNRLPISAQ